MIKVLTVIVTILLVGCAAGLVFTYQSLGTTQDTLEETRATLYETQVNLQDTSESLEETRLELRDTSKSLGETRLELQDTTKNLAETQHELEEQKGQTEKYLQLYESGLEELQDKKKELDTITAQYAAAQQTNQGLQETIDDLQSKLDLYEDTLGTYVYSNVMPPYRSGNVLEINLINQSAATDPTWLELRAFLQEDKTDKNLYIPDVYMCGNFAQDLHNNAEASGIRAAFVAVHFYVGDSHALNAFKTVDKGLVYIDDTGMQYTITLSNLDTRVEMAKDEIYRRYLVFPEGYWILTQGNKRVKSIEIYW
jgi:flagellar motor protein MotB